MDGAKRKRDYESGADVIGAALSRMEEAAAPAAAAARGAAFMPAPAFAGARPGYYFGRGAQGVGYYADSRSASRGGGSMPPPPPRSADAQVRFRPAHHACGRRAECAVGAAGFLRRIGAWRRRMSSARCLRPNAPRRNGKRRRCRLRRRARPLRPAARSCSRRLSATPAASRRVHSRGARLRFVARSLALRVLSAAEPLAPRVRAGG